MAPYKLGELVAERLDRCRALLAEEGGEHYQSADMQCWVDYAKWTSAMHELATDKEGKARSGLTLGEQLELAVLYVRHFMCRISVSFGLGEEVVSVLNPTLSHLYMDLEGWEPLSLTALACGIELANQEAYEEVESRCAEALRRLGQDPELAATLPQRLAAAGCQEGITEDELRQAVWQRRFGIAFEQSREQLKAQRRMAAAEMYWLGRPPLAAAAQAAEELINLRPRDARFWILLGEVGMQTNEVRPAASALRKAVRYAETQNAHFWRAQASSNLALALMSGAQGDEFEPRKA